MYFAFSCSQNNAPAAADDWSGFESYTPATAAPLAAAALAKESSSSRRSTSKKVASNDNHDFGGLDVKSMGSSASGVAVAKKPEDDAWDLLNN